VSRFDLGVDETLSGGHQRAHDAVREGARDGIAKRRISQCPLEPGLEYAAPVAHRERAAERKADEQYHGLKEVAP